MLRISLALALGAPLASAQDAPALPTVPDGFRVELIQAAPELLWPSAVHCLSDGSLLVAEDPMDMVGPADEPIDRILKYRWTADGGFERTVFCSDLYAVFGLQEIDGAVYVMNMPHLTVLRDADGDGVAEERRELITDLGPPAPGWPGGFNDHVVSGLRLGMDGWLYVSVGDKGVPRATGTDGSSITLRGGGVVRLRPDGTQLEVVARGTRNHLNVALDERDQIFTYDNTDDGLGWWTRLTHVIPTGSYGYPWDHDRHPERALPAMAEYGGGSPTGGLVYRGGVWPDEYQGNLFFCEWGKSTVRRFVLAPDGASFQVVQDEDFMTGGGLESFRPTDVCASPDGRFLYVADWGFGGWTSEVRCGRLFRVRRADDEGPPAGVRPRLYRLEEGAPVDEPNFRARLLGQRALARITLESLRDGTRPIVDETLTLANEMLAADRARSTRRHALWLNEALYHALSATDEAGAAFARAGLVGTLTAAEPELRAEAARALGSRRIGTAAELAPLLADEYAVVRREAATALGRVGDPSAAEALTEALAREEDEFVRAALRGALRALGAWKPVLARLAGAEDRARVDLALVLRGRFEPALVDALRELAEPANAPEPELRALVLSLLADVERRAEPWDGLWWGTQPARREPPHGTLDWEKTPEVRAAIRAALADPNAAVRRAALDAVLAARDRGALSLVRTRWSVEPEPALRERVLELVEELRDEDAAPLLGRIVGDPGVDEALRRRAIEVASTIASSGMTTLLAQAAGDAALPVELRARSLAALGALEDPAAVEAIRSHLRDPAPELRAAAARALGEADGEAAAEALLAMLVDEAPEVRGAAAMALAELGAREALPEILELVDEPDTRAAAIDALARMPDPRALSAYVLGLEDRERARREACADALRSMQDEVKSALEGLHLAGEIPDKALAQLQAIYSEPAPIRRWRILGPIEKGESAPRVADGPPEFNVPLDGAGAPLDHASDHAEGRVDLKELLTDAPNQVAYARAQLDSPIARGADVVIGSDDQLALWVNGELVYEYGGDRGWAPEHARVPVQLRAGANVLVARVGQTGGSWLFNVKVGRAGEGTLFQSGLSAALDVRSYREYALEHTGDPTRGRAVFEDAAGAACVRCHAVGGEGPRVGPDLGDVGARYGRAELATAVLEPSAQVADGYRTSWFELADGTILFAQIEREEDGRVWGVDTNGDPLELDLTEVVDRGESPLSLMPGGLTTLMSPREFSDLLAYLESLRGGPAPLPALEDLFVAGEAGYHTFRIPALLATPEGALLAFCEGRGEGSGDAGNIDIVLRRSLDGGRTWGGLQLVAGDGVNTVGNPCPVYDRETGKVLLLATWNKGSDTERRILDGTSERTRRVWMYESEDQGQTWSAPRDITDQAKRPDWRWYATGPGVGIQLASGRLVVPCDHSEHVEGEHPYRSHVILSDDHGATWRIGEVIGERLNECQVVERRDGSLWITMRSYHGEHRRGVATSTDGGETWSEPVLDPALVGPVCQASAIRWIPPEDDGRDWILHANPASEARERMTVKASPDGGASWPYERVVYPGAAAYSSLAQLPNGEVLLLFERDGYERITLARVLPFWKSGRR